MKPAYVMVNSNFKFLFLIYKSDINEAQQRTSQSFFQLPEVPLMPISRSSLSDFKYLMLLLSKLKIFPRGNICMEGISHAMCGFQFRKKPDPPCVALRISSEHKPYVASPREGPSHCPAAGHCQSPFSW